MRKSFLVRVIAGGMVAALALSGCATLPAPMRSGPLAPLPSRMAEHYSYSPIALTASHPAIEQQDGFSIERFTLNGPSQPDFRPIRVDWYRPNPSPRPSPRDRGGQEGSLEGKREKLPTVLISPILAGNDLYIREFARFFAARGLNAVIVYRPKEVFSSNRPLSDIEAHLRESIIQLRQVMDWLEQQDSVDREKLGSFAISMGALLTSVLAAVEPRVKASVLGLPAGRIAEILMASQDKAIRKRRENYLKENNLTREEAQDQLTDVIVSEPMTFAPAVEPGRVLMISGLFDRVLGLDRSLALWKRMGRPRLILLPTGHYTAALATPWLKMATYSFLKRKLEVR